MKRERVKLRSFGDKLKILRNERELTQEQFSNKMNVSLDTVKNWEQGYNYPSIDMLISISEFLRCDFDYLLGQQETPSKEYAHITEMIGISEQAAAQLINSHQQSNPIIETLSNLIEHTNLLQEISECTISNYGTQNDFSDLAAQYSGSLHIGPPSITPKMVQQGEMIALLNNMQRFIDSQRKKYGLPTSNEL